MSFVGVAIGIWGLTLVLLIAFDLDTVKLLMTLFDTDHTGTIGFTEVRQIPAMLKQN